MNSTHIIGRQFIGGEKSCSKQDFQKMMDHDDFIFKMRNLVCQYNMTMEFLFIEATDDLPGIEDKMIVMVCNKYYCANSFLLGRVVKENDASIPCDEMFEEIANQLVSRIPKTTSNIRYGSYLNDVKWDKNETVGYYIRSELNVILSE